MVAIGPTDLMVLCHTHPSAGVRPNGRRTARLAMSNGRFAGWLAASALRPDRPGHRCAPACVREHDPVDAAPDLKPGIHR